MTDTSTETHILISDSEDEEPPILHPIVPVVQADEEISPEEASLDARKRAKQQKRAEVVKKKRMSVTKKIKKTTPPSRVQFRTWCFTMFPSSEASNHWDRFVDRCRQTSMGANWLTTADMLDSQYQIGKVNGMVVGLERCTKTKRIHLQGCIAYKNMKPMQSVKGDFVRIFGQHGNTVHLEPAKGSSDENKAYCSKEELLVDDLPQFGRGARNDWHRFRDAILDGKSDHALNMLYPQKCAMHCGYIKWTRLAHKQETLQHLPKGTRDHIGIWISGPTGIGKSSNIPHEGYWLNGKWWDGYQDEELVIIDDPIRSLSKYYASELKRLVVENPVLVEPKGGMMCIRPKQVVVLCNYTMRDYFGNDSSNALSTRFTEVMVDTREQLQAFYRGWDYIGQDVTGWSNATHTFQTVPAEELAPVDESSGLTRLPLVRTDSAQVGPGLRSFFSGTRVTADPGPTPPPSPMGRQ